MNNNKDHYVLLYSDNIFPLYPYYRVYDVKNVIRDSRMSLKQHIRFYYEQDCPYQKDGQYDNYEYRYKYPIEIVLKIKSMRNKGLKKDKKNIEQK